MAPAPRWPDHPGACEEARAELISVIAEVEERRAELTLEEIATAALAAGELGGPVDPLASSGSRC
jgi:hypothetical protein